MDIVLALLFLALLLLGIYFLVRWIIGLVKKDHSKKYGRKTLYSLVASIVVLFAFVATVSNSPSSKTSSRHDTQITAKERAKKASIAKAKSESSKKDSESIAASESKDESSKKESESIADSESKASSKSESKADSESEASSESESIAESKSDSESESIADSKSDSESISISSSKAASKSSSVAAKSDDDNNDDSTPDSSDGGSDLYTKNQGDIIGNSNSHIYHVPGQAGYHMSSANAVHFKTEAEAQAAGYRKSER